ncbi:MAG: hypothetical protein IJ571_06090 [Ruminococcus sp.]|nr:hypothetical protein [Ruminococcus sp.]
MKILTESEMFQRKDSELYFKNGKPKKKYMECRNPEYIREVAHINGHYNFNWACAGISCPFYSTGCDDKGREWE